MAMGPDVGAIPSGSAPSDPLPVALIGRVRAEICASVAVQSAIIYSRGIRARFWYARVAIHAIPGRVIRRKCRQPVPGRVLSLFPAMGSLWLAMSVLPGRGVVFPRPAYEPTQGMLPGLSGRTMASKSGHGSWSRLHFCEATSEPVPNHAVVHTRTAERERQGVPTKHQQNS